MAEFNVKELEVETTSSETLRVAEGSLPTENEEASNSKVSDVNLDCSSATDTCKASESELGSEDLSKPSTSKQDDEPEWLDILGSGHLKKKVLVKGKEDSRPHRGETVVLDIEGKLGDGTQFDKRENVEVCIGDAEVVQGIDYALPLMDHGETAEIVIGPRFGYGTLGAPPHVPRDATLYYTVTVKDIIDIKDIHSLSISDRLSIGLKKKEQGNWWYQRKENRLAIQCYRKALQYFEEDLVETNEELNQAKLKTHNNLCVAHFNIEAYDAALQSVNNVLSQEPNNIKAIYRKVRILKAQGEIEAAITVAKKGLRNKPDSPALQEELNILIAMKKKSTSAQKVLYKKMFKNAEGVDKLEPKPKTVLSITWKWLGIITVAVGIIGAAAIKYRY